MQKCLPKHFGARNELIACTWLLNQSYEVFRNISQHAYPVDTYSYLC